MDRTSPDTQVAAYTKEGFNQREEELVSAAQAGAVSAFNELCRIYSKPLYGIAFYITKNREDAEDALQDSFLRAYMALKNFQRRSSFYTWLTRIAINSSLMVLRKTMRRQETSLLFSSESDEELEPVDFKDPRADPEQRFRQCQRHLEILRAIERLAQPLRELVELRMKRECTIKEAARILDISEAAAKSRMFRARMRLSGSRALRGLAPTGD